MGKAWFLGAFDAQLPRILKEVREELNCVTFVDPIQPHGRSFVVDCSPHSENYVMNIRNNN